MPIENKNYSAKELDDILSQYDIRVEGENKSVKRKKFTDNYAEIDDDEPDMPDPEHISPTQPGA